MKKRSSSIIYIIVITLVVAAALLCLLAFTRGKLPGPGRFAEAASGSEDRSPEFVSENSDIHPEKDNNEPDRFLPGILSGSSTDTAEDAALEDTSSEDAAAETSVSGTDPESVSLPEETASEETPEPAPETPSPTPEATPEATPEPTPDPADYLSDLETVPATTLVDTSLLDPENLDKYFQSYEISDALFDRIYGDNRSYKTYCTVPREHLRYIKVLYNDFEGNTRIGEIMVNYLLADDILYIFEELYKIGYTFELIVLVDDFEADDDISILHNNTSAFNYRNITGADTPSNHAYGTAIDINPYNNPYIIYDEAGNPVMLDAGADQYLDRDAEDAYERHMINYSDPCYQLFTERGWAWGGDWSNPVDYQHFEKVIYP